MKNILITGASGFLGGHLLQTTPQGVRVFAQYGQHPLQNLPSPHATLAFSFAEPQWEILEALKLDLILHAGAMAFVDDCENRPAQADLINTQFSASLAQWADSKHIRLVFVSTDLVFDGEKGNYAENDSACPILYYGRTKLAAEDKIKLTCPNSVIARTALFYGPSLGVRESFTEQMLRNLKQGQKITVFSDQYRSPILVSQLAQALWELCDHNFRGIIHLGGDQRLSRLQMGQILSHKLGLDESLLIVKKSHEIPNSLVRPLDCSLNITLAKNILKSPLHGFTQVMNSHKW